ncbi:hypothetical protein [Neptunomonas qingdaonensis]|uniref:PLD-like domain-containing protein n=1 Tax=Neptunomonas qingdaonensis TaxID=1045558 RepID=A0A1I2R4D9_9GAMM|nr:hypothetical protein [Neptunomonas qingdaonensis]SFG32781.1 hypothetical protein SAMN05216175_105202 [Neptunomonas qingdaonensis]
MEPEVILAQLRALFERAPDFNEYTPTSRDHMTWLGQGHALISRWNRLEASSFQIASDFLPMDSIRDQNVAKIFGVIQRAISDLELTVPNATKTVFGAGEVYDVFRALNRVVASAEMSIFIIDPYLDDSVFNHYLNSRKPGVRVRLLLTKNADQLKPAAEKYIAQYGDFIEIKKTKAVHDRVIFIDGYVCWVLGQSLKDAAKAKPTYLAPLSPDVIPAKLEEYEKIWGDANVI